ncbi:MAG: ABC transporter ATP-binding protein, partial [Gammaproteobacteria bacterium]
MAKEETWPGREVRQHNVSPSRPAVVISGLGKQYSLRQRADFGGRLTERIAGAWRRRGRPFPDSDAREIWALRDVTLDIERGEAVGVIGRNGAGKTTLLKILARITPPTEGEVELRGRVGSLLEVGTGFHQDLTGRENVFLNGAILG